MTFQQVRDVVDRISEIHRQMSEYLEQARESAEDPRTRLLLESFRAEQQSLQTALARFGAQGQSGLLDTFLQYIPDEGVEQQLDEVHFDPEMTPEKAIARKLEYDDALITFYRRLAAQTQVPRVAEFFNTLLADAEGRAEQLGWSAREFQADGDAPVP